MSAAKPVRRDLPILARRRAALRTVLLTSTGAVALSAALALPAHAAKVSMETATANSVVGLMPQTMAPIWAKAGVDVELAMGQTLTKSLLKVGQGTLDAAVVPPPAYADLLAGQGPYKQLGDKARGMAGNVRSLFGFPSSVYHPIVWADSGIDDWSKIKGKRVYLGPPAGAANAQIRALVKVASGYEEGKDYSSVKAPWGAAGPSFKDGQYDVNLWPLGLGAQALAEMGLARKFRILPLPANAVPPKELGLIQASIPPGLYPGQVNTEAAPAWQTVMTMMVRKDLSDDAAYRITKAYFESIPAMRAGNAMLKDLKAEDRFGGVLPPLHPGAVRFYKEQGIAIPADLMPR
jgi:hypothetical protein